MPDEPTEIGRLAPLDERPAVTSSNRIRSLAAGLRQVTALLEKVAIVAAIGGVLAGVLLLFVTSEDGYDTTHPFVGLGFGVAAASIVGGMFNWCVARALRLYAEHTAALHAPRPKG